MGMAMEGFLGSHFLEIGAGFLGGGCVFCRFWLMGLGRKHEIRVFFWEGWEPRWSCWNPMG